MPSLKEIYEAVRGLMNLADSIKKNADDIKDLQRQAQILAVTVQL